jgi:MoxR-like ATPase
MTPTALTKCLQKLVSNQIYLSTMIWGAPGIGKSSIVSQIAQDNDLDFIDLRLSQLAPTDLRGLPVAIPDENHKISGTSTWYPPEFLPRTGKGILFLDELNMAPPAMQGVAQQLILDRQVGAYQVPKGWFIWSAGNRREDRASVFAMPAPLANRFLHLEVEPDLDSFKSYAISSSIHEQIIAFLSYRTELLHKLDPQRNTFPSPRTWEMASKLHQCQIDVSIAVGEGAAAEFYAFVQLYQTLPDLTPILENQGENIPFPQEASTRYATTIGLAIRANEATQAYNAMTWLSHKATAEWVQLYMVDVMETMRKKGKTGAFATLVMKDKQLQKFIAEFQQLMTAI